MTININRLLEFTRGGKVTTLSGDLLLYRLAERVQVIDPTAAGRTITLPDFQLLDLGGPHFYIINTNVSFSFEVESSNMQESFTIGVGKAGVFSTFRNVGQLGWFVDIRDFLGTAIGELAP